MMEDSTGAVAHILVPVLIVPGELDQVDLVDALKSEVLARVPGATTQTLPGTGHLSPLESSVSLAEAIAELVDTL